MAAKGPYRIIRGNLDDLKSLPPLHVMFESRGSQYRRESAINHSFACLEQAAHADDFETLIDVMRTRNMESTTPLPDRN